MNVGFMPATPASPDDRKTKAMHFYHNPIEEFGHRLSMAHKNQRRSSLHTKTVMANLGKFGKLKMTPLIRAAAYGDLDGVLAELDKIPSADLDEELCYGDDWAGSSPLHWAAYAGNAAIVAELLDRKADPMMRNSIGNALPVHLAARYNSASDALFLLIESGPIQMVNAVEESGNTPLHEAAYEGHLDSVRALVANGAELEARNGVSRGGLTPLLAATLYGHVDVVKALVDARADVTVSPTHGIPGIDRPPPSFSEGSAKLQQHGQVFRSRSGSVVSFLAGGERKKSIFGTKAPARLFRANASYRQLHVDTVIASDTRSVLLDMPGHGVLSVAMRSGQLNVVSALLSHLVEETGFAPPLITLRQLSHIILRYWAKESKQEHGAQPLTQDETVRLFTMLVLCARPEDAPPLKEGEEFARLGEKSKNITRDEWDSLGRSSFVSQETLSELSALVAEDSEQSQAASAPAAEDEHSLAPEPPNPVLVALQLASRCITEAPQFAREPVVAERMMQAAGILELVASGLLYGAVNATKERAEVNKSFNPWRTGRNQVDPSIARDFFATSCLPTAAAYDLKIFVSNPFVSAHMLDLFWPSRGTLQQDDEGSGAWAAEQAASESDTEDGGTTLTRAAYKWSLGCLRFEMELALGVVANLLALPLMLFIPRAMELEGEQMLRDMIAKRKISNFMVVIWFFPAGRFVLWSISAAGLALMATFMPVANPEEGLGVVDAAFFLYLLGWVLAELNELMSSQLDTYFRDPFNLTDMLLIVSMAVTLFTRFDTCYLITAGASDGALGGAAQSAHWLSDVAMLPSQAICALLACLRMVQILFIFPKYGPLLIMAIRMLEDLMQFLTLALFVIASFGAAFFVLFNGAAALNGGEKLSFGSILMQLLEGAMDGEPSTHIMGMVVDMEDDKGVNASGSSFAWFMMAIFGMVVVLLLLNMLIARFAKTFDLIHEDLAGTFKVAFARVAIKGAGLEATPPPFNLLRGMVLLFYEALHACSIRLCAGRFGAQDDGAIEDAAASKEVSKAVVAFLQKATSPEAQLYPERVEAWVRHHQHDFGRDEQWRKSIAKQMGMVTTSVERMQSKFSKKLDELQQANMDVGQVLAKLVEKESKGVAAGWGGHNVRASAARRSVEMQRIVLGRSSPVDPRSA